MMAKSLSFSTLIFLAFALFETAILSNISALPCSPDFLLICLVFLAVNNGKLFGACAGFISGLILDFLTGSPFGFNCLLRTVLGYSFGFLNKTINISGFFFPFFMGLSSSILKDALLILIAFLYPNVELGRSIFSLVFLMEIIFNTLLTPFVYKFMRFFENSILLSPENVV